MNIDLEKHKATLAEYIKLQEQSKNSHERLSEFKKKIERTLSDRESLNAEISNELLDKIVVHKVGGNKRHVRLEILLNIGKNYSADIKDRDVISLQEIGISQAQVSRLEKSALSRIKKQI